MGAGYEMWEEVEILGVGKALDDLDVSLEFSSGSSNPSAWDWWLGFGAFLKGFRAGERIAARWSIWYAWLAGAFSLKYQATHKFERKRYRKRSWRQRGGQYATRRSACMTLGLFRDSKLTAKEGGRELRRLNVVKEPDNLEVSEGEDQRRSMERKPLVFFLLHTSRRELRTKP
jgi:hypothetical protein